MSSFLLGDSLNADIFYWDSLPGNRVQDSILAAKSYDKFVPSNRPITSDPVSLIVFPLFLTSVFLTASACVYSKN